MSEIIATEQTQSRIEWQRRLLEWLLPRISGGEEDALQFVDLWSASMSKAHSEGIEDAIYILERLSQERSYRVMEISIKALKDLNAKNKL